MFIVTRGNSISHSGIKGQKWGVRRFQNEDGSLTAAGKIRYQDLEKDIKERTKMSDAQEHSKHFSAKSDKLVSAANNLGKEYETYFKRLKDDPAIKKAYAQKLKDDYDGDDAFADDAARDVIEDYLSKNKDLMNKRDSFQSGIDDFFKDAEARINPIIAEYANVKIKGTPKGDQKDSKKNIQFDGQKEVERLLYNNMVSGVPSHLSRHFDDYWVYDTNAYSELLESLSGIPQSSYNED